MSRSSRASRQKTWFLFAILAFTLIVPLLGWADVVVNDVTQLNPITVADVITPTTTEEVIAAVKNHAGPISIGGGRYSMGGQTAVDQGIQIDMRQMNQVLAFSAENKEVTVQAGITWRKLQEYIDPYNLSLRIMQTYDNFTVGGSLSVNVHGRYVGEGPLVRSVKAIHIVLASGELIKASPTENSQVFYGAIGGYGGLGVIVDATLDLTDNVKVERQSVVLPLKDYPQYFNSQIKANPDVIFHNGDIYPNDYNTVRATSYVKTDKPLTIKDRLIPLDKSYRLDRFVYRVVSGWPFGKSIRRHVIDPMIYRGDLVEWRNYEASYRVEELEPASRQASTYVLQEYFVPTQNFLPFVADMTQVLKEHHVNVINISIRHAHQDPGTLMAWARQDVFAFVLYYRQGTSEDDRKIVGSWTRELIDKVIAAQGSYYLPYQIHATVDQFHAAYPKADQFFVLKQQLDPSNKFRNKLWDAYYLPAPEPTGENGEPQQEGEGSPAVVAPPETSSATSVQAALATSELSSSTVDEERADPEAEEIKASVRKIPGYARDEGQTYLTFPEWFLVYSPDEYAQYIKQNPNSGFPYYGSIGQFWGNYRDVYRVTKKNGYPTNWGYHLMVSVIGTSYTVELGVKGAYENSIGRVSEWSTDGKRTPEDDYAAKVAQDYVDFIRVYPWYEFSFWNSFKGLWSQHDADSSNRFRRWERKGFLSAGYLTKSAYGGLIKVATKAIYGDADSEMMVLTTPLVPGSYQPVAKVRVLRQFKDGSLLLVLPRYEEFRDAIMQLSQQGVGFREIAGNGHILMTCMVPEQWQYAGQGADLLFERPILTGKHQKRVALNITVPQLKDVVQNLRKQGIPVEHLYDF